MALLEGLNKVSPDIVLFRDAHPMPAADLDMLLEDRRLSLDEPQPHKPGLTTQKLRKTLLAEVERKREENVIREPIDPCPGLQFFQQERHVPRVDELDEALDLGLRALTSDVLVLVTRHVGVHVLARVDAVRGCAWDCEVSCVLPR